MKIGSKVKDKDTRQIGEVVSIYEGSEFIEVKFPDGRTVIEEAGKFLLIAFFEWIWGKLFGSDKKVV